jgi:hypothetical protein
MSKEFEYLQLLLNQKKFELKLKHHIKDMFGLWLHGVSVTRPALWNLFGYARGVYMFLFSLIVWIPVTLFLGYKYGWIYLFVFFIPYLVRIILKPIGQGFLLADLKVNEDLFNMLWNRKAIGICSIKKKESVVHKNGVPEVIIDSDIGMPGYVGDWKSQLSKIENLE